LGQKKTMKLLEFESKFPDEATCRHRFRELRDEIGVKCRKCEGTAHYYLDSRCHYKCKYCGYRTPLRRDTVLYHTKMSFRSWFMAIHLLTATKKSMSAKEIQRQMEHNRYQPVWYMLHKLRIIMGKRDSIYKLAESVEIDEGFFERAADPEQEQKAGRGSNKTAKVLVMIESRTVENPKNKKKPKKVGYLKMVQLSSLLKVEIMPEIEKGLDMDKTHAHTDGNATYKCLKKKLKKGATQTVAYKTNICQVLPWVHTAIANAKSNFRGAYHCRFEEDYIQNYLNEFVYKFNRRYMDDLFGRLLNISVLYNWCY